MPAAIAQDRDYNSNYFVQTRRTMRNRRVSAPRPDEDQSQYPCQAFSMTVNTSELPGHKKGNIRGTGDLVVHIDQIHAEMLILGKKVENSRALDCDNTESTIYRMIHR